jgi:hypothetical protein
MAKISAPPILVRLREPADMAAAIPHLVGFHPEESLVVISLRGTRKRIGLTMRFDLAPPSLDERVAEEIAIRLAADKAEFALLACCTAEVPDVGPHPRTELIRRTTIALRERGIEMLEALLVRDGRWWSYKCDDPDCCPPDGGEIPEAIDIAAAHAMTGRALLPSRDALRDRIKPVEFVARRAMEQALDRANGEMVDHFVAHGYQRPCLDTVDLLRSLVTRFSDPRTAALTDEEAARVIAGVEYIPTRDVVFAAGLDLDLDVVRELFIELSRRAVPPHEAPTCTLLAGFAYAGGNGGLANIALDRAMEADPAYSLAQLINEALYRQVPPALMRKAWREATKELTHKPVREKNRKKAV